MKHVLRRAVAWAMLTMLLAAGMAPGQSVADSPEVVAAALSPEARHTLELIASGGPYPYQRDGVVFGNREQRLPLHARGYYHEYTVTTPGVRTRGTRRIICGGTLRSLAECYYTDDHYESFRRIKL
ncbi:MAG: ribonuclease [Betaproteobacteria bacterium]|nr:MAG: ribonuclease [Betaproteobacteria bacterium]